MARRARAMVHSPAAQPEAAANASAGRRSAGKKAARCPYRLFRERERPQDACTAGKPVQLLAQFAQQIVLRVEEKGIFAVQPHPHDILPIRRHISLRSLKARGECDVVGVFDLRADGDPAAEAGHAHAQRLDELGDVQRRRIPFHIRIGGEDDLLHVPLADAGEQLADADVVGADPLPSD